jgi:hypothetical protein
MLDAPTLPNNGKGKYFRLFHLFQTRVLRSAIAIPDCTRGTTSHAPRTVERRGLVAAVFLNNMLQTLRRFIYAEPGFLFAA